MKYTEKVNLTCPQRLNTAESLPESLSGAVDLRYGEGSADPNLPQGGGALSEPPPLSRPESMLENCCKSAQIRAQNRLQNHFKTSSQEVLQTPCKSGGSFAEKIHEESPRTRSFDCSEPLKLLYFTAVSNISQCSQATPTMLVTDMKTCVRDLMFDPETIEIV